MNISVFGLGYVGVVSAACLAKDGHTVIGVDPNDTKVALINEGRSPIIEAGVESLVSEAVAQGRLTARPDAASAVAQTEISLVCVGTPSQPNGSLDLSFVRSACAEIGKALAIKGSATWWLCAARCCLAQCTKS